MKNAEGYKDTTAYFGMQDAVKEEEKTDRRADDLIFVLKYIIQLAGFKLTERIKIRDVKSGKEYK